MKAIAIAALAAIALAGSVSSVAGPPQKPHKSKPSSYAPQPHSNHHVYGTPIQPPILGHSKASRHEPVQKKQPASETKRRDPK